MSDKIKLTTNESLKFYKLMSNPPESTSKLKEAARDYLQNIGDDIFSTPSWSHKKPTNEKEYDRLQELLDQIIDIVRGNEEHPLSVLASEIGDNLEEYDNHWLIRLERRRDNWSIWKKLRFEVKWKLDKVLVPIKDFFYLLPWKIRFIWRIVKEMFKGHIYPYDYSGSLILMKLHMQELYESFEKKGQHYIRDGRKCMKDTKKIQAAIDYIVNEESMMRNNISCMKAQADTEYLFNLLRRKIRRLWW